MKNYLCFLTCFRQLYLALFLFISCQTIAQVSGVVFKDFNANGTQQATTAFTEPGLSGVLVKAYDASGAQAGTTQTTSASGTYSFTGLTLPLRIEFTLPATYYATKGTVGNTTVQFYSSASTTANLSVSDPECYWDNTTDPSYSVPCYVNGTTTAGGTDAAIVSTPYSSTKLNSMYQDGFGVPGTGTIPKIIATAAQVGTVWGEAYQKNKKQMFFATFLKRHAGIADGPGYIYVFDYSTATPSLAKKFNLEGVTPANGGSAIQLGSVCRDAACASASGNTGIAADYTLATNKFNPSIDLDAFGKVGKMAYGDIDMQPGSDNLWAVNLYQQALLKIDVSGNAASLPGPVSQYILADLPGYPTSTTGVLRPWGLAFSNGKGYLGVVSDASISKVNTDLKAYVLSFDPNNMAAGFTVELNFNPNIKRDSGSDSYFHYWLNAWSTTLITSNGFYSTPVLSDIDFDANGNMYLSLMDRFGHQVGSFNHKAISKDNTTNVQGIAQGDILKACFNGTSFSVEGTGSCVPGTGQATEFFKDIAGDTDEESAEGATAILKGNNQLLVLSTDPHPQGSTGQTYWSSQGTNTYNLTTGQIANWYGVYQGETPLYGKANGLGDLEFVLPLAPIEIGNRVWADTDNDGIQDAGETGIAGITVTLCDSLGIAIPGATATTDNNGNYYFSSATGTNSPSAIYGLNLALNAKYILKFPTVSGALTLSTKPNIGGNDLVDTDADATGKITFYTGFSGQNDHSFDVGYTSCTKPTISALPTVTQATCTGSTANSDAKIDVTGISGGDKYAYGADSTTFKYASATAFTGASISITGLANPAAATTYYVRVYNTSDDCYKTVSVVLDPKTCTLPCIKPTASVSAKTQSICINGTAAAYTTTPSMGVEYTWYGPLTDTTGSLGTALSGQTAAAFTPTGADLTTAGTKYYAVVINNTGQPTCADTAFVILKVNAKPTVVSTTPLCHANGTPEVATDDYMTFSLNITESLFSLNTFTITATQAGNPIAVTLSNGNPATVVNCGLETALRTPAGSAGKGNIILTITNNGNGCSSTVTITDPGTCAVTCVTGTNSTVSYQYTTQVDITELDKLPIILPQFDQLGGTRVLKEVKLEYVVGVNTNMIFENRAANPQSFKATATSDGFLTLNGTDIATTSVSLITPQTSLPAGILVPAQGHWPGDGLSGAVPSTLAAMPWIDQYMTLMKDPQNDPRWVTIATGQATNDDDIYYAPAMGDTVQGTVTYTTAPALAPFLGTGSVPLTASTLSGFSLSGGGGNIFAIQRTRGYAGAKVTYTYECVELCVKPIAKVTPKTQTICIGSTPVAYTATPGTGVEYKWYGPLADTTSSLGTALSGQTLASFTPTGADLTTAGIKYYAVVINNTGQATCGDTAFVQLIVSAKPTIVDGTAMICAGESVDLTSKITNYATLVSPVWTVATAAGTAVSTPTAVQPTATTTYVLVAQNDAGCKDTATVVVTVNPKPNAGVDIVGANAICTSVGAVTLTGTPANGTWAQIGTTPGVATISSAGVVSAMTSVGTYQFTYTLNGCIDTVSVETKNCAKGSLGDLVWKDTNDNGIQDLPAEKGVPGVILQLVNATTNAVLATDTTDAAGIYSFTGLESGDYKVKIVLTSLPDTCQISKNRDVNTGGGNDTNDSDFNPTSGESQVVTISTTGTGIAKDNPTIDAALVVPCTKSKVTLTGAPVCSADVQTYSVTFNVTNKLGTVKVNKGTLTGSNPYTVTGVPSGATLTITDSLSAVCKFDTLITGPNCNCNPPVPTLLTPSLTACIGDTFPTIKAMVVGLATVEWFTTASGGVPVFTGLNYKPVGTIAGDTVFYAQARSTDPTCPSAISTTRVPATVNAQNCTKIVDLALKKYINTKIAQIGDELTYTVKVFNQSNTAATGVEVTDSIATTVQFIAGSFVPSRGSATITGSVIKWVIGGIAANPGTNGDTVTLVYKVKAIREGIHFNTAEISKTNEKDVDSTPDNGKEGEDDIDRQCFTVPSKLCTGEKIQVSVPAKYTNVQWFKNGGTTAVATGNVVLLTEVGTYTFTSTNQTCPDGGCCPVIIEAGTNCCLPQVCVPVSVKKIK